MKRELCLILGGAGFIGSHVAEALVEAGRPVRLFDLPHRQLHNVRHLLNRVELMEGDFDNEADLRRAVADVDCVFHFVGTSLPASSNENPIHDVESNLIGTLRLLRLLQAAGTRRIVFCSSGGTIYGVPETTPIPETHPTLPLNSYGITKLTIEKYLHLYYHLYGLDYVVLRVSNPYGERQQTVGAQQGVVSVFMECLREGRPITIWGDGSVVRDFLYIKDVAQAFRLALDQPSPPRVFNVGSGQGVSLNELLAHLQHVTGLTPHVNYTPARPADVPCNILDTARIRETWGWTVSTPMEVGLARTWEWAGQEKSRG